jgi:hypothetical protein
MNQDDLLGQIPYIQAVILRRKMMDVFTDLLPLLADEVNVVIDYFDLPADVIHAYVRNGIDNCVFQSYLTDYSELFPHDPQTSITAYDACDTEVQWDARGSIVIYANTFDDFHSVFAQRNIPFFEGEIIKNHRNTPRFSREQYELWNQQRQKLIYMLSAEEY